MFKRNSLGVLLLVLPPLAIAVGGAGAGCIDPARPDHRAFSPDAIRALDAPNRAANLVVGDSIAERWPAADIARWMGGPVRNLGVSGDTPRGLLWRLGQIAGTPGWRRILLIVGVNGAGGEPACHDVAPSIEADVHALRRLAPDAVIVVLAVMPAGPGLSGWLDHVRAIDATLAADAPAAGFALVDANAGLLAACQNRPSCPLLLPDWLHPTPAGYRRIGPMVRAAFRRQGQAFRRDAAPESAGRTRLGQP